MDTNKMRDLKVLAEAAPSGPWLVENDSIYFKQDGYTRHLLDADSGQDVEEDHYYAALAFMAAANPSVVLTLLAEVERLSTNRSRKERELEQELEVWRTGPSCWTCGDTGDVHDITGEWRGECDCLSAQLINVSRERDQLKAENEALRKDAERYRAIRDEIPHADLGRAILDVQTADEYDAAVDAALAKEATHD